MYRGRLWTMRQFAGFGSAADHERAFKFLLSQGQTGLPPRSTFRRSWIRLRLSRARGEVGMCGVAVDSLKDMEILFDGIPLDKVTTSMTINGRRRSSSPCTSRSRKNRECPSTRSAARSRRHPQGVHRPAFVDLPSRAVDADHHRHPCLLLDNVPKWNTISISGYHIREAGSTAVQELAFTIADGIAYVQAGIDAGIPVDKFAPRLSYFFNAHMDFFEEIAKYRGARRMWARNHAGAVPREKREFVEAPVPQPRRRGARSPRSSDEQRGPCRPPGALGVLGGTQSLHTKFDGRNDGASHRAGRHRRAADPADHRGGVGRRQHHRSSGRVVLRGTADERDGREGDGVHPEDRRDGRDGGRDQTGVSSAGGGRRGLPSPAAVDAGRSGSSDSTRTGRRRRSRSPC